MRNFYNYIASIKKTRVLYKITSILLICILLGVILIGQIYSQYLPPPFPFFKHASFHHGFLSTLEKPDDVPIWNLHGHTADNFQTFPPAQPERDRLRETIGRMFGVLQTIFQQLTTAPRNLSLLILQLLAFHITGESATFIPQPFFFTSVRENVVMPANQSLYQLEILRI
jgi:hypothetical protein